MGEGADGGIEVRAQSAGAGLQWLAAHAWPLWLKHGVDWQRRAFHEHLDPASLECRAGFRRLRVAARQTYVFSTAAARGLGGSREAVTLGLEFLQGPARLADGGFAWRFDLDNRPIDQTRDLYDHAFVLLAFATAAGVVGAETMRGDAVALADYIETNFRHPQGGYAESIPAKLPRRQNPHMHLLEAMLAASEAFGEEAFFARAAQLVDLFLDRMFQPAEEALPELFDAALAPLRDSGRFAVEPGHHYEWVWLLDRYARRADALGKPVQPGLTAVRDALFEFANRHAISPCGLVVNSTWSDGKAADGGFRLWPQTERLKAEAQRGRLAAAGVAAALGGLQRHMAGVRPGLWIERMDAAMQAAADPAPATSLYHLTAALTDDAVMALTA